MDNEHSTALVPGDNKGRLLNKTKNVTAITRVKGYQADYVPHIDIEAVKAIADAAGRTGRHRGRDSLLVETITDPCLRITECLRLRPRDIKQGQTGWYVEVWGKGGKPGVAAISATLAAQLQAYAYRNGIGINERLFPINRTRAFQIISRAMKDAGIRKPEHVGAVHVLRHTGALERLRATGNPRSVQEQLRHSTAQMTLRYLKTLSIEESLQIQQEVDFQW